MALVKHFNHDYFNQLWADAQSEYRRIIADEKLIPEDKGKDIPLGDRGPFMEWVINTYFQYMSAYKKFDEVYDQMVHPQKRPLVRQMLDLTLARLIEFRETMVGTELSEYLYFDDVIHYYKWLPEDTDLPIPKYYYHERGPTHKARQELLNELIESAEEEIKAKDAVALELEKEQWFQKRAKQWKEDVSYIDVNAILIALQTVERQRQGLFKYAICLYSFDEEDREKVRRKRAKVLQNVDKTKSAILIQKLIRGFLARRRVAKLRERELIFLGIYPGPLGPNDERMKALKLYQEHCEEVDEQKERRRKIQRMYQKNYETAMALIKSKVKLLEAAEMAERMKFQIKKWVLDVKETKGKIPDLPKPEFGGSRLIFCPNTLPPEVLELANRKPDKNKKKDDKDKKKKKKKTCEEDPADKAKRLELEKKRKKAAIRKTQVPTKVEQAEYLKEMMESNKLYNKDWRLRNETDNPEQKHEDILIIREKRKEIGDQVRTEVDKLMKSEIKYLKDVLERRKKKKRKEKKKKDKGERKPNAKKKRRNKNVCKKEDKRKKKKGKDLTKGKPLNDLFEQLIRNGIIKKYPNDVRFDDLIGFPSVVNQTIRKFYAIDSGQPDPDINERLPGNANPLPTFGDIKRAIKDICILPMGSETVHRMCPYAKSLLIAGPKGSGKHSLVYAICNELGATLFDFSPRNLVGKYNKRGGLNMMFHLLNKVGSWAAPTIILIDNCEMQFMRRTPKSEQSEPKRIKKQMKKFIKALNEDDRFMVIGLSNEPWLAKMKHMKKDYQKWIYIPKPSYPDRLAMWRQELKDYMDVLDPKFSFELLAKLSDNWTMGSIKECVSRALKKHDKKVEAEKAEQQKPFEFEPMSYLKGNSAAFKVKVGTAKINMNMFIQELAFIEPVYVEQEKLWNKWYKKTPLQKMRLKFLRDPASGGQKGKKGKKGEKKKPKPKKDKKKKKKEFAPKPPPLSPKDSVLGF